MRFEARPLMLVLTVLALGGCRKELTERSVREFFDDADHAYLAGHASDICNMRSDDFKFTGTLFKLAEGRTVSDLAEALKVDGERQQGGDRVSGQVVTMNARDYCLMAVESRASYRNVKLVRTALEITVAPDHKQATARAHYVEKAPQFSYNDSTLSAQDRIEQQVGTLQTESDEESVVTLNAGGQLVFSSTKAVSRQFRVPKERDARL